MTTYRASLNTRGARRRSLVLAVAVLLTAIATLALRAVPTHATTNAAASYGYPVKPFDQVHPIRGNFGDPRTVFVDPPTIDGVLHSGGSFQFHFGVDISAPDGTPVYPVASGTVTTVNRDWVGVDSGNGRGFQYWHITPAVSVGQHVEVDSTVLGKIIFGTGHVHLTELEGGRPVNPLQPGHLTPYTDTTKPWIASISFRGADEGEDVMANFVCGSVEVVAEAYDMPSMPVPGVWHGLPVAPALLTWRIQRWDGKIIVPERTVVDFRTTEPSDSAFWSVYARGTFQNMSVFGKHYSYMQPGCYLFKLTPTPMNTTQLHDGVYDIVVTATDIRGNSSSLTRRFTVHNRPGWIGS
jgi:hypothetical protein